MNTPLGSSTYFAMISFKDCSMDKLKCRALVDSIVKEIEMSKAHEPIFFDYPFDGKGDGFIYMQPIIESFISMDYWDSLRGGYLMVSSCKKFEIQSVIALLNKDSFIQVLRYNTDSIGINE